MLLLWCLAWDFLCNKRSLRKSLNLKLLLYIFIIYFCALAEDSLTDTLNTVHFKIGHTLNFRDPKADSNRVDWHVGLSGSILFDSLKQLQVALYGSYERDNGKFYYAHSEKVGFRYGYINHIVDTEDSIFLFSVSGYYPVLKYFKVGMDVSWDYSKWKYGTYIGFNVQDWLSLEMIFWNNIQRVKGTLSPSIKLGKNKKIAMGIKAKVLMVGVIDKIDWNAGYFIEYSVDR